MKKILFSLLATILLSLNTQAQKVGENRNGKFVITEDLTFLKEKWNKFLLDSKIKGEIVQIEITSDTYEENKETIRYYQITGYLKDNLGSVASLVTLDTKTNFMKVELTNASTTVSCTGCNLGCHPRMYKGKVWYCSSPGCPEPAACTKTETITF